MIIMAIFIFLLGLAVGSFINALVFRTHAGIPVTKGKSKCMSCEMVIKSHDLVPIFSYFLLRGRCRGCKTAISWQYPMVELVSGALFLLMFLRYYFGWFVPTEVVSETMILYLVRDTVFAIFLLIIFVYDLRYQLILDRFTIPAIIFAFVINVILGYSLVSLLAGAFIVGGFFAMQYLVSKGKWIGGGDMRMGFLMGAMLGLLYGFAALVISYVLGAIVGIVLILSNKAKLHTKVPLGVFLALGTLLTLIFGEVIVEWYMSFF